MCVVGVVVCCFPVGWFARWFVGFALVVFGCSSLWVLADGVDFDSVLRVYCLVGLVVWWFCVGFMLKFSAC